jgi:hypothetical protein
MNNAAWSCQGEPSRKRSEPTTTMHNAKEGVATVNASAPQHLTRKLEKSWSTKRILATTRSIPIIVLWVTFHAGGMADVEAVVMSPRRGTCVSVSVSLDAPSGATAGRGTLVLVGPGAAVAALLVVVAVTTWLSAGLGGFCGDGGRSVADLPVLQTLGWEVINHGGLGRLVVVVVAAAMAYFS